MVTPKHWPERPTQAKHVMFQLLWYVVGISHGMVIATAFSMWLRSH